MTSTVLVKDPATDAVLAEVPAATPADVDDAIGRAADTSASWAATSPRARADVLRRAYELMLERENALARTVTAEMGKPLAEARGEVAYAAEFLRWFSEEATRIAGTTLRNPDGGADIVTTRRPVGPCYLVTPWNFPLAMGTRKLGPALAAGCTAVVKPSELTPLSMLALADILAEAGVPDGVVTVLVTDDAGAVSQQVLADPRIRKVSFTGSTRVGQILLRLAADRVVRASMELGGNAPFLVLDDADLATAVQVAVAAKMRNGGEACTSANRFLVHESLALPFADQLADRLASMAIGPGDEPDVEVGPLIHDGARRRVHALVEDAVARGATVLTGGKIPDGAGAFYPPTVLTGVDPDSRIAHEEIFGPVAAIQTVADDDQAVARANDTDAGLAAYVMSSDLARARCIASRLEAGMVGINANGVSNVAAPFGGVKASGLGREGGFTGIDEYLEQTFVLVPDT